MRRFQMARQHEMRLRHHHPIGQQFHAVKLHLATEAQGGQSRFQRHGGHHAKDVEGKATGLEAGIKAGPVDYRAQQGRRGAASNGAAIPRAQRIFAGHINSAIALEIERRLGLILAHILSRQDVSAKFAWHSLEDCQRDNPRGFPTVAGMHPSGKRARQG